MKLIKWSYMRRNQVKGLFDCFPDAIIIFKRIRNFYFIHSAEWRENPQLIGKEQLEEMEYLLNQEMGFLHGYLQRKSADNLESKI
ncbi:MULTISPECIES: hypothetical protein [unclassified Cytobacillus]|uniref:hypothetical protein n=1 Tax=unclassified Cytobacillus TaxID=2675268 RepID=UPI001916CA21|nr:hypothetical protein [Cytobacillus sp. AMY 15.2]MCM3092327.1 hypothetical protein [Cytobacillus sp. AMY 15.2]